MRLCGWSESPSGLDLLVDLSAPKKVVEDFWDVHFPMLWLMVGLLTERGILSMKNKTSELDTIPTNLLKDILLTVLETIT